MSPIGQIDDNGTYNGLMLLQTVDGRARMLPLDKFRQDALDDYLLVRDAWIQRRNHQIQQDLRPHRDWWKRDRGESFGIVIAGVRHCQRTAVTATRATAPLEERIGGFQVSIATPGYVFGRHGGTTAGLQLTTVFRS
jgi:hypothetical protein